MDTPQASQSKTTEELAEEIAYDEFIKHSERGLSKDQREDIKKEVKQILQTAQFREILTRKNVDFDRLTGPHKRGGKRTEPVAIIQRCFNCEIKDGCKRAFEQYDLGVVAERTLAKCVYDIEGKHAIKRGLFKDMRAFVSTDPADMLVKIESTFRKLEETVEKNPSYTKQANLLYMLINIYKLKFGEKVFSLSVKKDITNPTLDVKTIMKELRGEERRIIEVSRQLDTQRMGTTALGNETVLDQEEPRRADVVTGDLDNTDTDDPETDG